MPRLDARIKTDLPAKVSYSSKAETIEEMVRIKELSLSNGLMAGFSANPKVLFPISVRLPASEEIELFGEPVKAGDGCLAVRFYYPHKNTIHILWEYMKKLISCDDRCAYCGDKLYTHGEKCQKCGFILNFLDDAYLEKHLKSTLMERIQRRLNRIDPELATGILNYIDSETLHLHHESHDEEFVGTSPGLLEVFSTIRKVARSDMSVLVLGESGTGKELTAKAIHERSDRKDKPFVALNCAAIPEGLLEAELFGYEKGAFTGAYTTKKGKFEEADGGTIFLDEIGDLSPGLQAKLLRFLEDRKIERIGGKSGKRVDVRIVAATNCDLNGMVDKGIFRVDLFFRLNSFTIKLPPLRERGEDKVILAKYFFKKIGRTEGTVLKGFSEEAVNAIREYSWPGNVRELVNKVRRGLVMAAGDYIEPADMELATCDAAVQAAEPEEAVPEAEAHREMVSETLARNNFVIAHAAKALRISRPTLYTLIKKYEIEIPSKQRKALQF